VSDYFDTLGPGDTTGSPLDITPSASSGSATSSSTSPFSLGSLGTAAAGGAGLAGLFFSGSTQLPQQYQELEANVPGLEQEASTLEGEGQTFTNQGAQALQMAQAGVLTPAQQAQLSLYQGGLENTAAQTYASMGRNINQDTSGISTQANIDTQVNAMAQQIQSTITLGLGETTAGSNYDSAALGFENAADNALIEAGKAQVGADTSYSNALSGAFSAIGTILGGTVGAAVGGPAGAVAGASIGKAV
jgi:hypothetical protein